MTVNRNGVTNSNDAERHVLVLVTGGTICMQESPDGLIPTKNFAQNCMRPTPDFNDGSMLESTTATNESGEQISSITLRPPPRTEGAPRYRYTVLEFSELIDSSSMDGNHWNRILRCLTQNWNSFDAFLVLHGTDTLAYTASILAFALGSIDKTVVVTGSQLSMYAPHNDAHDNLLDSLTVAATYSIPEVSVVFHHRLYRATRVTKVSAFSLAAFTTPNARPLATFHHNVSPGQQWAATLHSKAVTLAIPNAEETTKAAELSSTTRPFTAILDTSRVAVLKVYPGISASLIHAIIQTPNLGGLVLETFGAGNIPMSVSTEGLVEVLSNAVKKGIVVVSVTQCTHPLFTSQNTLLTYP